MYSLLIAAFICTSSMDINGHVSGPNCQSDEITPTSQACPGPTGDSGQPKRQ